MKAKKKLSPKPAAKKKPITHRGRLSTIEALRDDGERLNQENAAMKQEIRVRLEDDALKTRKMEVLRRRVVELERQERVATKIEKKETDSLYEASGLPQGRRTLEWLRQRLLRAKELKDAEEQLSDLQKERDAIALAAKMPEDYKSGLPSWVQFLWLNSQRSDSPRTEDVETIQRLTKEKEAAERRLAQAQASFDRTLRSNATVHADAVKKMQEALDEAAARASRAEKRQEDSKVWYASRWTRLREFIEQSGLGENLPAQSEFVERCCNIMANGTADSMEQPNDYLGMLAAKDAEIARLKKQSAADVRWAAHWGKQLANLREVCGGLSYGNAGDDSIAVVRWIQRAKVRLNYERQDVPNPRADCDQPNTTGSMLDSMRALERNLERKSGEVKDLTEKLADLKKQLQAVEAGSGVYSQQTMDALVKERDWLAKDHGLLADYLRAEDSDAWRQGRYEHRSLAQAAVEMLRAWQKKHGKLRDELFSALNRD